MKNFLAVIVIFLALVSGCGQAEDAKLDAKTVQSDYRCQSFGGFSEDVCMASIFRLAAHPDSYEKRLVGVNGYIQIVDGDYYVFASKEFFDAKDFSNALLCDRNATKGCDVLASYVSQNATVFGRFSDDVAIGDWTLRPIGSIDVVKAIAR
jgi:hypothetical protein